MGMYNEVFKRCPECSSRGYMQISQIVDGFGEFNLDDPNDLADKLTIAELHQLSNMIQDEWFSCQSCSHNFKHDRQLDEKRAIASKLFSSCPCCGYPQCGHKHL